MSILAFCPFVGYPVHRGESRRLQGFEGKRFGTAKSHKSRKRGLNSDLFHWSKIYQNITKHPLCLDFVGFSLLPGHYHWCFGSDASPMMIFFSFTKAKPITLKLK